MILYHGSNIEIPTPDLLHSRDNVDFGKGFYTTPLYEQAAKWCDRFKKQSTTAVISKYNFDFEKAKELNLLHFERYSEKWLDFVLSCRNGHDNTDYDIVIGGVANDRVFNTVELYFASLIDKKISEHPNIEIIREEVAELPIGNVIIATGPLTSAAFSSEIGKLTGEKFLYFYDAVAPVVTLESVNMQNAYRANRYGDTGDYINCPMDEETYALFWNELVNAETAPRHAFEEEEIKHFEGCLPVEVIAKRGEKTLLFGPLRPVGLEDAEGKRPCAVVQLRQDNADGTLYNLVGFQTNLKWGEQERVFRLIPALKDAEFVRKGVMHRNLFVCAPTVLDGYLRPNGKTDIFLAGQITGVEGYVESTAMGFCAALFMYAKLKKLPMPEFPVETATGALLNYLKTAIPESFQPMNANLGIMPKLPGKKIRKRAERCAAYAERSDAALKQFIERNAEIFK